MTDLRRILPSFPVANFTGLLPAIENHSLTTTDLLTLHPADIAKQTHLPLLDLKRLIAAVHASLLDDLTPRTTIPLVTTPAEQPSAPPQSQPETSASPPSRPPPPPPPQSWPSLISTLDPDLDAALGGGIPTGRITEFAGESGAGKTQFLLSLSLAVQLPPPHGLARQALYISTESGLSTSRLAQMLRANQTIAQESDASHRPSLDNILSASLPDLESQDHILQYQVPVLLERHRIGLIVIDSVAANYRAEFERQGASRGSNMAARSNDLVRLGALLREFARRYDLAVVVANQVADRFSSSSSSSSAATLSSPAISRTQQPGSRGPAATQETPLASRSNPPQASLPSTPASPLPFSLPDEPPAPPVLALDHQQRWFTGWGDDPHSSHALKTPSLGLVWSTQIACRIALFKRPVYGQPRRTAAPIMAGDSVGDDYDQDTGATLRTWKRWMKVVFAPHAEASGQGTDGAVEFEINLGGLKAVKRKARK
ncbi:DNA repair protein-like protein [Hapsidospora chrysogenum ATCC 11550]|uniref:DNA repair protein-like protein n=1 Tax=Hapsidospora chrysogenum (strain ATCC 11550 / CBS 779.69 / DSM 880 / IAM 14645 / JCM 23072 / IMI 49137) TaxID=857340 RepID=A0A086TBL0_HAPC1|nr:DNA repair protein-like protein [Hapsidospora chrysogenum ATCC 11550]